MKEILKQLFEDLESLRISRFTFDDKITTLSFTIESDMYKAIKNIYLSDLDINDIDKSIVLKIFKELDDKGCIVKVATEPEIEAYYNLDHNIYDEVKTRCLNG